MPTWEPGVSWAPRASATAELIAQSAVFLSRDGRLAPLLPAGTAPLCERFLRAAAPRKLALTRLLSLPGVRRLVHGIERRLLPGIQLHYAARKRFIEDAARAFLDSGGEQIVVLGAGFDTLAYRLTSEHPGVRCIEVDHPATQARKRRALGDDVPPGLHLVAADLSTTPLADALGPFAQTGSSFFVLEGVSMYLTEQTLSATLSTAAQLGGRGARIVWTFMEPDAEGRIAFRRSHAGAVDAWLQMRGESFVWGIAPPSLPSFLAPLGWRVVEVADARLLRDRYLEPLRIADTLAEGEGICLAERAG